MDKKPQQQDEGDISNWQYLLDLIERVLGGRYPQKPEQPPPPAKDDQP